MRAEVLGKASDLTEKQVDPQHVQDFSDVGDHGSEHCRAPDRSVGLNRTTEQNSDTPESKYTGTLEEMLRVPAFYWIVPGTYTDLYFQARYIHSKYHLCTYLVCTRYLYSTV